MATANWQLVPHSTWDVVDRQALAVLSAHGVRTKDMAEMFFEGRTIEECEDMLQSPKVGPSTPQNKVVKSSSKYVGQVGSGISQDQHGFVATHNARPLNDTPSSFMVPNYSPSLVPPPVETSRLQRSISTNSLNRAESLHGRSETTYTDSQKAWEQQDRDIVWRAMKDNMTARDIQRLYLPSRSESAIQTRMCKERKIREKQSTLTQWPTNDSSRPAQARSDGYSPRRIPKDSSSDGPQTQCHTRYGNSRDPIDVDNMDVDTNTLMQNTAEEFDHQEIQEFADRGDDSDYVDDETPVHKRPGVARKTPASSKETPKKSPSSISSLRSRLLNAIDAHYLPHHKKEALQKALRKNWPTHFASVEGHSTPLPGKGARWSDKDTRALKIIYETVPNLPHKYIKEFFPGRNEASVSRQINSRLRSGEWASAK